MKCYVCKQEMKPYQASYTANFRGYEIPIHDITFHTCTTPDCPGEDFITPAEMQKADNQIDEYLAEHAQ